jgi:hypothetical protein
MLMLLLLLIVDDLMIYVLCVELNYEKDLLKSPDDSRLLGASQNSFLGFQVIMLRATTSNSFIHRVTMRRKTSITTTNVEKDERQKTHRPSSKKRKSEHGAWSYNYIAQG